MNFRELIEKDREKRKGERFQGTLMDYLDILKKNPEACKLAHKRLYDIIMKDGVEIISPEENIRVKKVYGNETIKSYNFFNKDFFGIDKTLMKLVNYFYSASMKGEEARQVLYLVGPVGSGKSSIVETLKKALENTEPVLFIKGMPNERRSTSSYT